MSVLWPDKVRCQCGAMTRNPSGTCCLCLPKGHEHPDPHDPADTDALMERNER